MSRPDLGQAHLFDPGAQTKLTLAEKFLVPPFSVLDARAGYWKDRKQEWLNLGIEPELGNREAELLSEELGIRSSQGQAPPEGRASGLAYGSGTEEDTYYRRERERAVLVEMHGCSEEEAQQRWAEQERQAVRKGGGIRSEDGRGDRLLSKATPREGYGGDYDLSKGQNAWGGSGTSIFDPVLCELAYRWFTPRGGDILDPFAGGSVRGIVAAALERRYLGIDLSERQVEANRRQAGALGASRGWAERDLMPEWYVGDARDAQRIVGTSRFDFIFSCPPYYNLEVYSDDPRDLSKAGSYAEFRAAYFEIICSAAALLRQDRFAAFVVGEVRAKDGTYCGLVPDTISSFVTAGLSYYNEAILLTAVGSLPIRTSRTFGPGRKLGKTHQNLLVFVKGDARKAAEACGTALEVALEQGGATWRSDGSVELEGERRAFSGEEPGA